MDRKVSAAYFRNFVFGVEDSLVSTVGLLSGVAIAGMARKTIFITGLVLIFVEAFSMAVGSLLSEHSAEGYLKQTEISLQRSLPSAAVMFVSYFLTGFIPLSPYVFFSGQTAFWTSIGMSLGALFILGMVSAYLSRLRLLPGAFRMCGVGGIAILIGILVGRFANELVRFI